MISRRTRTRRRGERGGQSAVTGLAGGEKSHGVPFNAVIAAHSQSRDSDADGRAEVVLHTPEDLPIKAATQSMGMGGRDGYGNVNH